ncbi:CARNS1 [Symbiodinium microadriaticum]|nr:CARNS1 [Symbiodinium microadriaticum]
MPSQVLVSALCNSVFESPFGLVEELLADNAWQLLATCVLLNKTGRLAVDRVLPEFLSICPGPHELLATAPDVLHRIFLPLGLHRKRARMLRRFSTEFLEAQKEADGNIALEHVRRFHGVGKYASDAYEIFILKRISTVQPTDSYLRWYSSTLRCQLREHGYNDLDEGFRDCMSRALLVFVACAALGSENLAFSGIGLLFPIMSCCGGCFEGLFSRQHELRPDSSPQKQPRPVKSYTEALQLERSREGTWQASPKTSFDWASPIPRRRPSVVSVDGPVDFDIVIDIDDGGKAEPRTQTIDTDIPANRVGAQNRERSRFEKEMLLASPGRLPPPLTADQREEAIRQLLPTATFQMLAKVPKKLLTQADESAKKLRRQLMRGATVVFVTAGLPGKRFTFEIAASLGIKPVILEHPDSWSRSLVDEGLAAKFIPVDMTQPSEDIFNQALEEIKNLGEDGLTGTADGIATFVELSVPLAARLAEALGLPGLRPAAVDSARNKHATRACLKTAGLPTPRNFLIDDKSKLKEAGTTVGFPAVLKPVSGAASLGVKKVTNSAEMEKWVLRKYNGKHLASHLLERISPLRAFLRCYKEIVDELSTLVVSSGALVQGSPDNAGLNAQESGVDLTVLMEQFLDGPEVDVDVVMSEGEYVYACVADNGPTLEPYFNETWACCPSLLPKDQQVALRDLGVQCIKALGFTCGVFHVELKYTSHGPQLIEVNARMGGGQVHECNRLTWGVDLVEETMLVSLGIPSRPCVPREPISGTAYCYVNAMKSGTVTDISKLEELRKRDNVVWAKPLTRVGAQAVGPADGLPTWLCDLFVQGKTAKEALAYLQAIEKENPVLVA